MRHLFLFLFFVGLSYTFVVPPFQSPDEENHFYRAWQVAEGDFIGKKENQRLGAYLPTQVNDFGVFFRPLRKSPESKTSFASIYSFSTQTIDYQNYRFVDFPNTAIYAPTAYLPQSCAIFIGKMLNVNVLFIFYLGRITNFLTCLLLVYFAYRTLPFAKNLLLLLVLVPSTLFISATYNADVISNGLVFLQVALILSLVFGEKKRFSWILLTVISLVVSINKIIFLPILLLLFLKENKDEKYILQTCILLIINLLAIIFWQQQVAHLFISFEQYNPAFNTDLQLNEGVQPLLQLRYIVSHPLDFLLLSLRSFVVSIPATTMHYFGKFGYEKNYLSPLIIPIFSGLLLAFSQEKNTTIKLHFWQRCLFLFVVIACFLAFCVVMYSIWSPVGSGGITNFQGRYFIPIVPLLLLSFWNVSSLAKSKILTFFQHKALVFSVLCVVYMHSIWVVLERYYY